MGKLPAWCFIRTEGANKRFVWHGLRKREYSAFSYTWRNIDVWRYFIRNLSSEHTHTNSALHPSGVAKSSTCLGCGVKAEFSLCRVAGNIVWSHMACEFPVAVRHKLLLTAIHCLLTLLTHTNTHTAHWLHYPYHEVDSNNKCPN